jgi:hypothetical protein
MQAPMQQLGVKQNAAWLLISGAEDSDALADMRRINSQLERFHPEGKTPGEGGLRSIGWPTSLQGGNLLVQVGAGIEEQIVRFFTMHVASREIPWITRRDRLP